MEKLINLVSSKANISGEAATSAVNTVMSFIKDKLPESVSTQVTGLLQGGTSGLSNLVGGASDKLGGLFGDDAKK